VKRIGTQLALLLRDLDPAHRRACIFGRERELGEIQCKLAVVDRGARELGQCRARVLRIVDC